MIAGYLFISGAAICWGLIGIFSSIAFSQGLSPAEVAFWRAAMAWVLFGALAVKRREVRIERKDAPLAALFGIMGISVFYMSYQYSVQNGGAALASVLLYTAPAWVVAASFFIYREKLTFLKLISVVMVISGVFLISRTSQKTSTGWIAIWAGLLSGFCYSLYYTIGKYFRGRYSSATLFFWILPIGAAGIFPFVTFSHKTSVAWLALISVAVISTFAANFLYYQGLKYLEAGKASIIATLEPVIAAFTAWIVLGEYFNWVGYTGAALILTAVLITIIPKQQKQK
ncbi:EamA family transporter [Myxococcota bacterium]|nr:EamA family transporter [Myxococcota bacterium]MBU1381049.1 EamA family transporter [Myxococcota bacterium]MBU1495428.1 EamA family transporter [Myxococcota bacterium]